MNVTVKSIKQFAQHLRLCKQHFSVFCVSSSSSSSSPPPFGVLNRVPTNKKSAFHFLDSHGLMVYGNYLLSIVKGLKTRLT
jgi:hypothetical protein